MGSKRISVWKRLCVGIFNPLMLNPFMLPNVHWLCSLAFDGALCSFPTSIPLQKHSTLSHTSHPPSFILILWREKKRWAADWQSSALIKILCPVTTHLRSVCLLWINLDWTLTFGGCFNVCICLCWICACLENRRHCSVGFMLYICMTWQVPVCVFIPSTYWLSATKPHINTQIMYNQAVPGN